MLLAGLTLEEVRDTLINLEDVPKLFATLISSKDLEMIALIGPMLKKCPLNAKFVERVIASGSIVWLIDVTSEINKEEFYLGAYSIIEALVPIKWLDDFGAYIQLAKTHLIATGPIAITAADYLMVISKQSLAIPLLQRANIRDFLVDRVSSFQAEVAAVIEQILTVI
jgi:hypothetical protein